MSDIDGRVPLLRHEKALIIQTTFNERRIREITAKRFNASARSGSADGPFFNAGQQRWHGPI